MKKIGLIIFLIIFLNFSYKAVSEETIEVEEDADVKALSELIMNISLSITRPCAEQLTEEMKQDGKTDQEIINLLPDKLRSEEVRNKCICRYKDKITEKLKDCDAIVSKHPEWRGKILVIREKEGVTTRINPEALADIKEVLSKCNGFQ